MPTIIQNLNSILTTKSELNSIIQENGYDPGEVFSNYPSYIRSIIESGGTDKVSYAYLAEVLESYVTKDRLDSASYAARDNYDGSVTTTTGNYWINNLSLGDKIKFYRAETTRLNNGEADSGGRVSFGGDCDVNLSGNLASLIGFSETLPTYCFRYLFYSCNIVDASRLELPWDTLTQACFIRLFF